MFRGLRASQENHVDRGDRQRCPKTVSGNRAATEAATAGPRGVVMSRFFGTSRFLSASDLGKCGTPRQKSREGEVRRPYFSSLPLGSSDSSGRANSGEENANEAAGVLQPRLPRTRVRRRHSQASDELERRRSE